MTDRLTAEARSRLMSRVRGADTKPEMWLRRSLHAEGFRYRLHVKDLPGRPDLVLRRYSAAIFVHGCFWHGHDCHLFRLPSTRVEFWRSKIDANRARDQRNRAQLLERGWRVLEVWECAMRGRERVDPASLLAQVKDWLKGSEATLTIRGQQSGAEECPPHDSREGTT